MSQRKPVKSIARSEAMLGNENAVKPQQAPEPLRTTMALKPARAERLRAAMIAQEGGGWPDDDDVKAFFRTLAYKAVDTFIERMERDNEGAMIL